MAQKKNSSLCVFHFVLDSVSLMNGASARCRSALILYLTLCLSLSFNFCLTDWLLRFQCPCLCNFFFFFFLVHHLLRMFTLSCNQDTHKHWISLKPKYLLVNLLLHNSARSRTAVTQRTVRYAFQRWFLCFFFPRRSFRSDSEGGARGDDGAPPPPALKNSPTELTQSVFSFLSIAVASFSGGWNHETAPPRLDFYCCFKVVLFLVCLLYISIDLVMGFRLQCNCVFFIF